MFTCSNIEKKKKCALIGHLPQAWAGTTWHVLALHRIWQTDEAKYLKITK